MSELTKAQLGALARIGRGGIHRDRGLRRATFFKLYRLGLITERAEITDAGRTLLETAATHGSRSR